MLIEYHVHLGKLYTAKNKQTKNQPSPWGKLGCYFVFFYRWSVICGHKEVEERVRKTIFILFLGPKDTRHNTPLRATWNHNRWSGGRRQEQRKAFIGVFCRKGKAVGQVRTGLSEQLQWGLGYRDGLYCLVCGPEIIKAEKYSLLGVWERLRSLALDWLVCTSVACSQLGTLLFLKIG